MESTTITNIVYTEVARATACAPVSKVSFFALIVVGLLVLFIIGLVILLAARKRPVSPAPMPAAPTPVPTEDRQAILRKLADGELTKPEAEELLNQLGTPVPVAMPAPPPASGSGTAKGCLIAALIVPIILLLLFAGMIMTARTRAHSMQEEILKQHIERVETMQESSQSSNFEHH